MTNKDWLHNRLVDFYWAAVKTEKGKDFMTTVDRRGKVINDLIKKTLKRFRGSTNLGKKR